MSRSGVDATGRRKFVLGVTGASGAPYAERLFQFFDAHRDQYHLSVVFSRFGQLVYQDEVGRNVSDLPFDIYKSGDMTAPFASGSAGYEAMAVVPCSAGSLARIAHGLSTDLVGRAADVMLKERRKLVLVLRESPYSLIQLKNMVAVTEAGAIVVPASPSFYSAPKTFDAFLDTVTARVLDQLGVDNALMKRWTGKLNKFGHATTSAAGPDLIADRDDAVRPNQQNQTAAHKTEEN